MLALELGGEHRSSVTSCSTVRVPSPSRLRAPLEHKSDRLVGRGTAVFWLGNNTHRARGCPESGPASPSVSTAQVFAESANRAPPRSRSEMGPRARPRTSCGRLRPPSTWIGLGIGTMITANRSASENSASVRAVLSRPLEPAARGRRARLAGGRRDRARDPRPRARGRRVPARWPAPTFYLAGPVCSLARIATKRCRRRRAAFRFMMMPITYRLAPAGSANTVSTCPRDASSSAAKQRRRVRRMLEQAPVGASPRPGRARPRRGLATCKRMLIDARRTSPQRELRGPRARAVTGVRARRHAKSGVHTHERRGRGRASLNEREQVERALLRAHRSEDIVFAPAGFLTSRSTALPVLLHRLGATVTPPSRTADPVDHGPEATPSSRSELRPRERVVDVVECGKRDLTFARREFAHRNSSLESRRNRDLLGGDRWLGARSPKLGSDRRRWSQVDRSYAYAAPQFGGSALSPAAASRERYVGSSTPK